MKRFTKVKSWCEHMEKQENFSDEALQALAVSGDQQAEDILVRRYGRLVKKHARSLFLVGGDSEDLIQEGMMGLLSAIRTYAKQADSNFFAYAELCIKRRMLNAIKTATRLKHSLLNESSSLELPHIVSSLEQYAQRSGQARELEETIVNEEKSLEQKQQLLKTLSVFEYQVLELFLEGNSYQEMADTLNKPQKSVDNAVQRIRKKLQVHL